MSISTEGSKVFVFGLEPVFTLVFDFASVFVFMLVFVYYRVYFLSLIGIVNVMVCCCCCLRDRVCYCECNRVLMRTCVYLVMMVLVWL